MPKVDKDHKRMFKDKAKSHSEMAKAKINKLGRKFKNIIGLCIKSIKLLK